MGGYAGFVWPAFGITTAVLVLNVVLARRRVRAVVARNRRRLRSRT